MKNIFQITQSAHNNDAYTMLFQSDVLRISSTLRGFEHTLPHILTFFLEAMYYTLCWLENEISKSISNHVSIRYENKLAHTHDIRFELLQGPWAHVQTYLRPMIRRTITLKSPTRTKISIPESYKDSRVCVHAYCGIH